MPKDVVYALRTIRKSPTFAAVAILTLTIGIGANATIFNLLNAIVLRPLPIPHPEELIALGTTIPDNVNRDEPFSLRMFEEINRENHIFSHFFGYEPRGISNFEAAGAHHVAELALVSGDYYGTMQIAPLLGRFINGRDVALDTGTSPRLAVISYRAWRGWYNSDPAIIGKTIRIERQPFIVTGVEPRGFSGLIIDGSADVTIPMFSVGQLGSMDLRDPRLLWLRLYGRLKPGITLAQARAHIETIWPHIQEATRPPGYEGARLARFFARRIHVDSARRGVSELRKRFSSSLWVLQVLVGAILLITCLNLTNLSLAKAVARQHESGVRAALGAGTWILIRQPVIESCLLSFAGSLLGLLAAYSLSRALLAIAWTGLTPPSLTMSPDWRVLSFTAGAATLTGLLIAIAPAWYAARMEPIDALKRHSRFVLGRSALFGKGLLACQMAVSVVVVASALLFGSSLSKLLHVDAGYRRDHLLTVLLFPQSTEDVDQNSSAYYQELSERLKRLPGVQAVSFSVDGPANEDEWLSPVFNSPAHAPIQAVVDAVGPDFFSVAGMHVLTGREFSWQDYMRDADVAVISHSLAERLFGKADPLGHVIYIGPASYPEKLTIVGVVNSASLWKVESIRPMALYRRLRDRSLDNEVIADIRTIADPHTIKTAAERTVHSLGQHFPLRTMTVEERLDASLTVQRLTALLSAFFAAVALLLAGIGIYGLISFHVTKRTAEIGVRAALGAQRWQLMALVLKEILQIVALGSIAGLAASAWTGKLVAHLLFRTSPTNLALLSLTVLTLVSVAVLAGLFPARRAAQMDPMSALRSE